MTAATFAAFLFAVTPQHADTVTFHQGVEYRIEATLDEQSDVLAGRARLVYTNNSGDTLDRLYLHQHLNAFRPGSAWARRELLFNERRFSQLGPDEHAFERFTSVEVDGVPVTARYPGAPDSTVAIIPLPEVLAPGASATVLMDWRARLATTPRRQGRRGRHYDFAQWYPRVAVYDQRGWQHHPLMPQGEFYGEFADYDVTLEVEHDQVMGASGVPVEGDPGWEAAAAPGFGSNISYQRDAYPHRPARSLGLLSGAPAEGRKRIRWRAEDVHHFAWSADPGFVYEGEVWNGVAVHVLYQSGAREEWGERAALRSTIRAMEWGDYIFGPYLWPQVTNLHRLESGGTEFPMLFMDGSASEGLIVHEFIHQYAHGMLANNEWRAGWLDEGLTSFLDGWYQEWRGAPELDSWGQRLEGMRQFERAGGSEPIATPAAEFSSYPVYGAMTYSKTAVVLRMLRWLVGRDTMREILRAYFDRYQLSHVTEESLRNTVNDVTGGDYDWFFEQWFHGTDTLDYGIAGARTTSTPDGRWRTTVQVLRLGDAWMPVTLKVAAEERLLDSRAPSFTVEVVTDRRPEEVVLDPEQKLLDLDLTNNRREVH